MIQRLCKGRLVVAFVLSTLVLAPTIASAQTQAAEPRPAPRWPDGRISFTGTPDDVGNWEGQSFNGATLFFPTPEDALDPDTASLPTNLQLDDVPFQPWARALFDYRQATALKDEPHTRCKPSGGARIFHTPYGMEILDLPDAAQIIVVSVGAPHSWRVIYMDGRPHPDDLEPSWYGHSVGHWEGDTLIVDTVGFNEKFWMSRLGPPHTSRLHTIERISRPDFNTLRYEFTVDDPGAYTAPWTGGWNLVWIPGNEPFDYLCQENNLDAEHMVGPGD